MKVVELKGIVKYFPNVVANDKIDFDLQEGEIHALLGENGAGKTTLMNILYGLYQPDGGEIKIKGKRVFIDSPKKAISLGIGMVHQHFTLVPSFSVLENIMLGLPKHMLSKPSKLRSELQELSKGYGLRIEPNAKIWQLSVGEMQRVEIMKLLYRDVDVLILDEPTAVLTPQEAEYLFKTLKRLANSGKSIVFISHKLHEVMEIADRITVLRRGKVVNTVNKIETSVEKLAEMMVGRQIVLRVKKERQQPSDKVVLKLEGVKCFNDKGLLALKGISLEVKEGEILGIAGVAGNGQRELAEVVTGLRIVEEGRVWFSGKDITNKGSKILIDMGGGYIPADRLRFGVAPNLNVADNLILKNYRRPPLSYGISLNQEAISSFADRLIKEYEIMVSDRSMPAKLLSGGNLQRVIIARELQENTKLIIAFNPTRGLDVSATEFVYNRLLESANKGTAVLLIAGDLEEIFTLSDRVAVLYEGEITGYVPPDERYLKTIGLLMAGVKDAKVEA